MNGKPWTSEEYRMLRENYPRLRIDDLPALLPGRTRSACAKKIRKLGIVKMPEWIEREEIIIHTNWTKGDDRLVAMLPGRTRHAIGLRRCQLGYKKVIDFMADPISVARAIELYKDGYGDLEIARSVNRSQKTIFEWRRKSGLPCSQQTEAGRRRLRDRWAMIHAAGRLTFAKNRRATAASMGYANARHPKEAMILAFLSDGPKTNDSICQRIEIPAKPSNGHRQSKDILSLCKRGIIVRKRDGRTRTTWFSLPIINAMDYENLVMKLAVENGARHPVRDSYQYSAGFMGLMKAIGRFDPNKGFAFATLAYRYIDGNIKDEYRIRIGTAGKSRKVKGAIQLSQMTAEEDDDPYVVEDSSDLSGNVELREILETLDERSKRLVIRVHLEGYTLDEAGRLEEPPITKSHVQRIVSDAIETMQERSVG
jgi:RNA polymerase sigma factor (sigma-70 family)